MVRITGLGIDEFFLNTKLKEDGYHYFESIYPSEFLGVYKFTGVRFAFPVENFDYVIREDFCFTLMDGLLTIELCEWKRAHIDGEIEFNLGLTGDVLDLVHRKSEPDVVATLVTAIAYTDGATTNDGYLVVRLLAKDADSRNRVRLGIT
jgi:hypothetical protein